MLPSLYADDLLRQFGEKLYRKFNEPPPRAEKKAKTKQMWTGRLAPLESCRDELTWEGNAWRCYLEYPVVSHSCTLSAGSGYRENVTAEVRPAVERERGGEREREGVVYSFSVCV